MKKFHNFTKALGVGAITVLAATGLSACGKDASASTDDTTTNYEEVSIEKYDRAISGLNNKLDGYKAEIEKLQKELDAQNKQNAANDATIVALTETIEDLNYQLKVIDTAQKTNQATNVTTINELKTTIANLQKQLAAAQQVDRENNTKILALQENVRNLQASLDALELEMFELYYTQHATVVSSYQELVTVINQTLNGVTVQISLGADLDFTDSVVINKNVVLDLNGHLITNSNKIKDNQNLSLFSVQKRGVLTIKDSAKTGRIWAQEGDCYVLDVRDGAQCIIDGGSFKGNIATVLVHAGNVTINGGTFDLFTESGTSGRNYMLNCSDANYKNGQAKIAVKGGTFVGFNPANNNAEGENTNFCALGYDAYAVDGGYQVIRAAKVAVFENDAHRDAVTITKTGITTTLTFGAGYETNCLPDNGSGVAGYNVGFRIDAADLDLDLTNAKVKRGSKDWTVFGDGKYYFTTFTEERAALINDGTECTATTQFDWDGDGVADQIVVIKVTKDVAFKGNFYKGSLDLAKADVKYEYNSSLGITAAHIQDSAVFNYDAGKDGYTLDLHITLPTQYQNSQALETTLQSLIDGTAVIAPEFDSDGNIVVHLVITDAQVAAIKAVTGETECFVCYVYWEGRSASSYNQAIQIFVNPATTFNK